ncbi:hypothetical protein GGR57DRAFT_467386 [Xylariaceae sp. FL1272]|nr:hypothetical protein GGR57DRAFT_467386 [Xylariaceae sp. FL1272]
MRELKEKSDVANQQHLHSDHTLGEVRHYLGRLAHHIRAPKKLLGAFLQHSRLQNVLEEFEVGVVPVAPCVQGPHCKRASVQRNRSRNHAANNRGEAGADIFGILRRMLSETDSDLNEYGNALQSMDERFGLQRRVREAYENPNFKPQIHAEIQVLEHFYAGKLRHFDNDRYIGCSKPACYCCHLYISHHPARYVVPQTSHNLWLNWGLRAISGKQDPRYVHQRDMLNKMLGTIRRDALQQIIDRAGPHPWHADSQTGITQSVTDFYGDAPDDGPPSDSGEQPSSVEHQSPPSTVSFGFNDDPSNFHSVVDNGGHCACADSIVNDASCRSCRRYFGSRPVGRGMVDHTSLDSDSESDGGAPL